MQNNNAAMSGHAIPAPLCYALRSAITKCAGPLATLTDLIDCADLASVAGASEIAVAFRQTAHMLRGFTPDLTCRPTVPESAIHTAITELRQLMHLFPEGDSRSTLRQAEAAVVSVNQTSVPGGLTLLPDSFVSAIEDEDAERLAQLIATAKDMLPIATASLALDGVTSLAELADAVIGYHVRTFLEENFALYTLPFGSPAVLIAAARMSHGALGPYFSGIGRLLRQTSDLFGLVALAAKEIDEVDLDRWLVMLASRLSAQEKHALIAELADRGEIRSISGIYECERQRSSCSDIVLRQIRDAALDLGDLELAIGAQSKIIELEPYKVHELVVLAEIHGTNGDTEQALSTLEAAQKLDPRNKEALLRVDALQQGKFERYYVNWGYHSTDRQVSFRAKRNINP